MYCSCRHPEIFQQLDKVIWQPMPVDQQSSSNDTNQKSEFDCKPDISKLLFFENGDSKFIRLIKLF